MKAYVFLYPVIQDHYECCIRGKVFFHFVFLTKFLTISSKAFKLYK